MDAPKELFALADRLAALAEPSGDDDVRNPLLALEAAANQVKRSFSGSWLGYHSRVYYEGLIPAPAGANFSQEWGLQDMLGGLGSRGKWRQFDPEDVKAHIWALSNNASLERARTAAVTASEVFRSCKSDILSILQNEIDERTDGFLTKLKEDVEGLEPLSTGDVAQHWAPHGSIISRDMLAIGQGNKVPAHVAVLAEIVSIRHSFDICKTAADISRKAGSHIERRTRRKVAAERVGTNVFIGHGRSAAWRELKDFMEARLRLPWDEFNRVPVAGVTNVARLSEMLDAAAIAFLVMTAEDEMADGGVQARMNVVHEAGLFQGRLGFSKAIVLLESGCTEFSNIQGLGQIRFPEGNISAAFEDVRRVLEREGLLAEK